MMMMMMMMIYPLSSENDVACSHNVSSNNGTFQILSAFKIDMVGVCIKLTEGKTRGETTIVWN